MRTIVEIPEDLVRKLDRLREGERVSRSQLIREAIESFLLERKARSFQAMPGFGCWDKKGPDGVEHQRRMRAEWRG